MQTKVQLIREILSISCWHLVNSHLNPADIVSRGLLLNELVENEDLILMLIKTKINKC